MTNLHEHPHNLDRYLWLCFVEFLDMLCRIAIVAITIEDTLDYKTHLLLSLIYNKYYDNG